MQESDSSRVKIERKLTVFLGGVGGGRSNNSLGSNAKTKIVHRSSQDMMRLKIVCREYRTSVIVRGKKTGALSNY